MIVIDMTRGISLPIVYLTDFGGIVFDKIEVNDTKYYIIHISTLRPIDIEKFVTETSKYIFEVLKEVSKPFREGIEHGKVRLIISGRIPLALLPCLMNRIREKMFQWKLFSDEIFVFDPKLRKACSYDVCVEIPEEIVSKLISEYDEIVKQRHSMQ